MLQGSVLLYLLPIVCMIMAAVAINAFGPESEWPIILAGLSGLGAGMLFLKHRLRGLETDNRYQPVILRRLVTAQRARDGVFSA